MSRPAPTRGNVMVWIIAVLWSFLPVCVWARDPAALYMMECQGCHLADGSGALESIPALNNQVAKFLDVAGGREYLVQVPGVALSPLSDQEMTDVLNWMLAKFGPVEPGRPYEPYSVNEVARLRKQPLTEITQNRANLILLMRQRETLDTPG